MDATSRSAKLASLSSPVRGPSARLASSPRSDRREYSSVCVCVGLFTSGVCARCRVHDAVCTMLFLILYPRPPPVGSPSGTYLLNTPFLHFINGGCEGESSLTFRSARNIRAEETSTTTRKKTQLPSYPLPLGFRATVSLPEAVLSSQSSFLLLLCSVRSDWLLAPSQSAVKCRGQSGRARRPTGEGTPV